MKELNHKRYKLKGKIGSDVEKRIFKYHAELRMTAKNIDDFDGLLKKLNYHGQMDLIKYMSDKKELSFKYIGKEIYKEFLKTKLKLRFNESKLDLKVKALN